MRWPKESLSDVITLQRGHDLPEPQRRSGDVPILGSTGISGWHDVARYPGPGVTIGRSGHSIGVATYSASPHWPLNTALFVKDFKGNNPRWVYYLLRSLDFSAYNSGSAQPSLNRNYIANIPVPRPPRSAQDAIAEVLAALDDKIEANRQVNRCAARLARAHFAKLMVMAATDSRTVVKPIGALATIFGGATPSTKVSEYWSIGTIAWATPKDLAGQEFPVLLGTGRKITPAGAQTISSGVLPKGTVLLSSRAPIGYLAVAETPIAINQGFIAMVPDRGASAQFLLRWAESSMPDILARANGTTFLEISKHNFRPMLISVPGPSSMARFDEVASPLHAVMVNNLREIHALSRLRDSLLAPLLLGDVVLQDAADAGGETG